MKSDIPSSKIILTNVEGTRETTPQRIKEAVKNIDPKNVVFVFPGEHAAHNFPKCKLADYPEEYLRKTDLAGVAAKLGFDGYLSLSLPTIFGSGDESFKTASQLTLAVSSIVNRVENLLKSESSHSDEIQKAKMAVNSLLKVYSLKRYHIIIPCKSKTSKYPVNFNSAIYQGSIAWYGGAKKNLTSNDEKIGNLYLATIQYLYAHHCNSQSLSKYAGALNEAYGENITERLEKMIASPDQYFEQTRTVNTLEDLYKMIFNPAFPTVEISELALVAHKSLSERVVKITYKGDITHNTLKQELKRIGVEINAESFQQKGENTIICSITLRNYQRIREQLAKQGYEIPETTSQFIEKLRTSPNSGPANNSLWPNFFSSSDTQNPKNNEPEETYIVLEDSEKKILSNKNC